MVDAISAKTTTTVKPVTASAANGTAAYTQQTSSKIKEVDTPLNPRLVYDKLAGVVVTEFLGASGTVQLQTPSSAVLAYLRAGLGADGYSKHSTEVPPPKAEDKLDS